MELDIGQIMAGLGLLFISLAVSIFKGIDLSMFAGELAVIGVISVTVGAIVLGAIDTQNTRKTP